LGVLASTNAKTRQPQLKQGYQQAAQQAQARFLADGFTQTLPDSEQQQWLDWATWMCAKFQRTSSAVEGRNGYLSGLHQANRGFTEQTLKVLTVIHNFDLRRDDGTTAAQRLFGKPFPVLFDWVVLHMGELPRPRRTLKAPKSKSRPYMLSRLKLLPLKRLLNDGELVIHWKKKSGIKEIVLLQIRCLLA
jgi:hypothetical protein